jgi:hypothetical protein
MFDSIKEKDRYIELKLLEKAGLISRLKLQPKFELIPKQESERAVMYYADFQYREKYWTAEPPPRFAYREVVEDVKGVKTKDYIIKRKLFKQKYPWITFREV